MDLKSQLFRCAELWVAANDSRLSVLAKRVCDHSQFFERKASPTATVTLQTLEKFGRFLALADHWPGGDVPEDVIVFVHALGLSLDGKPLSAGKKAQISRCIIDSSRARDTELAARA